MLNSGKKILNETKTITPPLQVKWSVPNVLLLLDYLLINTVINSLQRLNSSNFMVFCFVQNFFFGQRELEYLFFLSRKVRNFFPEFNIRLYDKNSESDYFFFLHQNQNIFFSNIGNQNIFFRKPYPPPPPPSS